DVRYRRTRQGRRRLAGRHPRPRRRGRPVARGGRLRAGGRGPRRPAAQDARPGRQARRPRRRAAGGASPARRGPHAGRRARLAPHKPLDAVEAAVTLPFADGIRREAELFRECLFSDQSRGLIHVFFGERAVAKVPGLPRDVTPLPIRRAAVVGAGTMGGGIAMAYANAGIPVLLKEVDPPALDRGLATIRKHYAGSVHKGRLSQQQMDQRLALIRPTLTYDRFQDADVVVEAVFEGMELKKRVFAELDRVTR